MAIPFSQSKRSLRSDRGYAVLIGMAFALGLLLLWSAWFLWAPVTRYASGSVVGTTRSGRILADFPSDATEHMRAGQNGYLRPHDEIGELTGAIPVVVAEFIGPLDSGSIRVSFYVPWEALPPSLQPAALTGNIDVEVEAVSPARLVARAAGQYLDSPAISFSPQ